MKHGAGSRVDFAGEPRPPHGHSLASQELGWGFAPAGQLDELADSMRETECRNPHCSVVGAVAAATPESKLSGDGGSVTPQGRVSGMAQDLVFPGRDLSSSMLDLSNDFCPLPGVVLAEGLEPCNAGFYEGLGLHVPVFGEAGLPERLGRFDPLEKVPACSGWHC